MPRETPHTRLIQLISSLERCWNLDEVFEQIQVYLARMGLEFGTVSVLEKNDQATVVKVKDKCQAADLNRLLKPLGKRFEYLGHTLETKDTIWQDIYHRGQTLASDNILLGREHPNLFRVPWQDCLAEYFRRTPVEDLLQMIGTRPVLHALGINQIVVCPFAVRDQLTGSILIWGSQSKPIDDAQVEVLQVLSRIVSLASSGILRSQAIKRTLDNFEVAEVKYTRLVHNAPAAMFEIDFDGNRVTALNDAATALTGYTREELLAMDPIQLVAEESQKVLKERIDSLLQGKALQGGAEYKIIRKDGSELWAHVRTQAVFHGTRPLRGEIIAVEITDLKQTEKALRQRITAEAVVSKVAMAFNDLQPNDLSLGVARALEIVGRFGRLKRCYFVQLTSDGSSVEETYEWCDANLEPQAFRLKELPIEATPWWLERLRKFDTIFIPAVEALPAEARAEKEILRSHQTPSVLLYPVVAGWGLIGFVGLGATHSLEDWLHEGTTLLAALGDTIAGALERLRAEKALCESLERFKAIAKGAFDTVIMMDDGTRVLYCNPAGESTFALSTSEISGTPISEILYPGRYRDTFARIINDLKVNLSVGKTGSFLNLTALRPGGGEFPVEIALSPIHLQDHWYIIAIVRDVSGRELPAPEQPSPADTQMTATSGVDSAVKQVAHTVNNLLTVIERLGTLLESETPATDPRKTDIQTILQACRLGYRANLERLGIPPEDIGTMRILSIEEILTSVQQFLQPMLPPSIAVEVILAADLIPVMGDKGQLTHTLINLCINSAQAMPEGGTMTIECRNLELKPPDLTAHPGKRPGTYLLIRVQDTGGGMDRDVLAHATEPFFSTRLPDGGPGLGLSMVYGTIESHGGIITMDSAVGVGTTVTILLPAAGATS